MPKETAFGGSQDYRDYKAEGERIGKEGDREGLKKWMGMLVSATAVDVQRSAAVCYAVGDSAPNLFRQHVGDLIKTLRRNVHPAGPRLAYRALAEIAIEEEHQGELIDLAFQTLQDRSAPIAVQVFAMTVVANHIELYPNLAVELEAILKGGMANGSAGYKSRARSIGRKYNLRLQ